MPDLFPVSHQEEKASDYVIHNAMPGPNLLVVKQCNLLDSEVPSRLRLVLVILLFMTLPYPELPVNAGFQGLSKAVAVLCFRCPQTLSLPQSVKEIGNNLFSGHVKFTP